MTIKQIYSACIDELAFTDCGEFETQCLFEDLLGVRKEQIIMNNIEVSDLEIRKINSAVQERKNGKPLQYILGKWDFYDLTFKVGEGVLIPRPETEMLVDYALDKLKNIKNPVVYDLCAGSGCIGLTVAKHIPNATVYLLEKEEKAYKYLCENKTNLELKNAIVIKDDLFTVDLSLFPYTDIILSNPPYIEKKEVSHLQKEVLFEPVSALDGGIDGLNFYRCLADRWCGKIKQDGFIALECGEEQSRSIVDIFKGKYTEKQIIFDFNDIDRIVTFRI